MSEQVLTRPRRSSTRRDELRRLVLRRDALTAAIELEQELAARRLDEKLRRAGYTVTRRQHWPRQRERFELTGARMRRGPWLGGAWAEKTRVRLVD